MPGFTDTAEKGLLDYFVATYGVTTKYIGLSSTTPTEAGANITEPTAGAYARVATTSADWSAASGSAPAVKTNTAVKTFPTATADWLSAANLTYFVIFDAATTGNALAFGLLQSGGVAQPKAVLAGDTPSFAAGALVLELGDPGDTF
jgi:hypothetical protein